jgi:hypothetical protein
VNEREVTTVHGSRAKLARQGFFRSECASKDDDAARVFVEPLDDAERGGRPFAAASRKNRCDEPVERSPLLWLEWDGADAGRHIDDDEMRIHVQQRRAIEPWIDPPSSSRFYFDGVAFRHPPLGIGDLLAAEKDLTSLDETPSISPGQPRERFERAVERAPGKRGGNDEAQTIGARRHGSSGTTQGRAAIWTEWVHPVVAKVFRTARVVRGHEGSEGDGVEAGGAQSVTGAGPAIVVGRPLPSAGRKAHIEQRIGCEKDASPGAGASIRAGACRVDG